MSAPRSARALPSPRTRCSPSGTIAGKPSAFSHQPSARNKWRAESRERRANPASSYQHPVSVPSAISCGNPSPPVAVPLRGTGFRLHVPQPTLCRSTLILTAAWMDHASAIASRRAATTGFFSLPLAPYSLPRNFSPLQPQASQRLTTRLCHWPKILVEISHRI
jgi:hypothetical protein